MKQQMLAIQAEFIKIRNSKILWVTFIAFSLAPVMGGVFILIIQHPEALAQAGGLTLKARAMHFEGNWESYIALLTQTIGVGGVLVFGFIASWIFGREYADGTAKDLLSLPTSRAKIVHAKFITYLIWCLALAISNLLTGFIIGTFLHLPKIDMEMLPTILSEYFIAAFLTILIGTPIAFFALWGKGYLTPLGFVALTLVFAQIIAATGFGSYFPWSIPGLYSGAAEEYKKLLDIYSYAIVVFTGVAGYYGTILFWKFADQTK